MSLKCICYCYVFWEFWTGLTAFYQRQVLIPRITWAEKVWTGLIRLPIFPSRNENEAFEKAERSKECSVIYVIIYLKQYLLRFRYRLKWGRISFIILREWLYTVVIFSVHNVEECKLNEYIYILYSKPNSFPVDRSVMIWFRGTLT